MMSQFRMSKIGVGLQKTAQIGIYVSLKLNDVKLFIDLYYPCIRWLNCAHLPHSEPPPSSNAEGLNLMTVLNVVTCTLLLSL